MESVILKAIWYMLHLVVDLIESFLYCGLELRENFNYFIKNIGSHRFRSGKETETAYIESRISDLKKLPKHIAVILSIADVRDVDLSKIASLVSWSLSSGVNFISFYDYKGILKNQLASSFHKTINEELNVGDNENIVWGPDCYRNASAREGVRFPHRNGYKRHIVINLYSSLDGYGMFNQLLREDFCKKTKQCDDDAEVLSSREITIERVEEKLSKLYGNMPDPELALYFGKTTCTAGFLPWHIRLTEFLQISYKLHHLSLDKFIRVLYKYAKCEQRYGK